MPYKVARQAFDRLLLENTPSEPVVSASAVEGRTRSASEAATAATQKDKHVLNLRVTRRTSDERLAEIKGKFLELLEAFRAQIRHDPATAHQLFKFVVEHTAYKARYGDLKKCLAYGAKHDWFAPMKRRTLKKATSEGPEELLKTENLTRIDNEPSNKQPLAKTSAAPEQPHDHVPPLCADQLSIDLLTPPTELEWATKPNGHTHRGLDKIIADHYAYMQKPYRGQFLKFCRANRLAENKLWSQLFEVDIADCAYLNFDPKFPLSYSANAKPSKKRYAETLQGMDSCLRDHYLSLGRLDEYYVDKQSRFLEYCDENAFNDYTVMISEPVLCDTPNFSGMAPMNMTGHARRSAGREVGVLAHRHG